jgi:hypothetical protein
MHQAVQARRRREWLMLAALSIAFLFVGAIAFGFIS